mgnify:CR=1 FL=1
MDTAHLGAHAPETFARYPGGALVGDDGHDGRLVDVLVYAARLGSNVGDLLGVGDPTGLLTTGSQRLDVDFAWTPARETAVKGSTVLLVPRDAPRLTVVGGVDLRAAIEHSVERSQSVPGVRWAAVVTDDMRVVGVRGPAGGTETYDTMAVLPSVGARALALWQGLPEVFRTDSVFVRFARMALLVAGLGRHVLVAFADEEVDEAAWAEASDEVRAVLAAQPVATAPGVALLPAVVPDVVAPASPPTSVEHSRQAPVGARYRARGRPRRRSWRGSGEG